MFALQLLFKSWPEQCNWVKHKSSCKFSKTNREVSIPLIQMEISQLWILSRTLRIFVPISLASFSCSLRDHTKFSVELSIIKWISHMLQSCIWCTSTFDLKYIWTYRNTPINEFNGKNSRKLWSNVQLVVLLWPQVNNIALLTWKAIRHGVP